MLSKAVTDIADGWWCRDFECAELRPSATHVQVHAGELLGNSGIWILLVGEYPMVSLPPTYADLLGPRATRWSRSTVMDQTHLRQELRAIPVESIVGPAFIGYITDSSFTPGPVAMARALNGADKSSVEALRDACTEEEWNHGGSALNEVPTFGAFTESGQLAALAGYKIWGGTIAHLAVVSAPDGRGHGFGRAAVATATSAALRDGLLPQYRTLVSNTPSMNISRRLGFESYGYSVYVRLGRETNS